MAALKRQLALRNQSRLRRRRTRAAKAVWHAFVTQDDPNRPEHAAALAARAGNLGSKLLVSVLWCRPADASSSEVTALLEDLAAQIHPQWELLLPSSCAEAVRGDERVRMTDLGPASDGAAAFNQLVGLARGEWVIPWRHCARLPSHALLLMAESAGRFRDCMLIYSDYDHLSSSGQREQPAFLCDRNLELERSGDYLGGLNAYRLRHLVPAEGLSAELGEAAWHDIHLKAFESKAWDAVVHVPHLLLHRIPETLRPDPAPPGDADIAAVTRHLARSGIDAEVRTDRRAGFHVHYRLPQPAPRVTAIIPTRNGLGLLRRCVASLRDLTRYPHLDLWIVDNGSDDPDTLAYLREISLQAGVTVRRDDRPFDFAALNNEAVAACDGDVVALLNNDVEAISSGWLEEMVGLAMQEDVGAVGARLLFGDSTVQHGGVILGVGGTAGHAHMHATSADPGYLHRAHRAQDLSAVTAACLVMRKSVYAAVGGMQAGALAVDLNDVDLCLRIRKAGLRVVWTPHAELFHHESATRGRRKNEVQLRRYRAETAHFRSAWDKVLDWDPAYNPNLSLRGGPWMFMTAESPRVTLSRPWMDTVQRLESDSNEDTCTLR